MRIATLRPFASESDLLRAVDRTWASLERAHQIEAFAAHPRVSDGEALRHRPAPALDRPLDDDTHPSISSNQLLAALAEADLAYEAKFDHIFIADNDLGPVELLELIRHRLANDPEVEHEVAAAEQVRITRRRLRNLLA